MSTKSFAKLFEFAEYGQVLVTLDAGDGGAPQISWKAKPPGLGLCSFAMNFVDSDAGWDAAEAVLGKADEVAARAAAAQIFGVAGELSEFAEGADHA